MSEPRKQVRFDVSPARSPDPEERYALKRFCQHIHSCSQCALSESRSHLRCRLCSSGRWYADELRIYLGYRDGLYYAKVRQRPSIHISPEFQAARVYLRYVAACRDQPPVYSETTTHQSPVRTPPQTESDPLAFVQPSSVSITPYLSSVTADPKSGETILHLTIPSFTVPVRVRSSRRP